MCIRDSRLTVLCWWQKQSFVQAVDELLTKLDEYVGFADLVSFDHRPFSYLIILCFVWLVPLQVNRLSMTFCCGTCLSSCRQQVCVRIVATCWSPRADGSASRLRGLGRNADRAECQRAVRLKCWPIGLTTVCTAKWLLAALLTMQSYSAYQSCEVFKY